MAATDNTTAINNAIENLSLRAHAAIPEDTATLDKVAALLKNAPSAEQIERLRNANVAFDATTADLSHPNIRSALNLLHTPVFAEEKIAELVAALGLDATATVVNEFNPTIRKAMKLPFAGPRGIVAQYLARLRVSENKSYSADGADRTKSIEETADSPLTPHHVNELLTTVARRYISPADLAAFAPCRYETRQSYFTLIAGIIERGTDEQLEALEEAIVRDLVSLYYTGARPSVYELFSHMAANELMLVDGDSLLVAAFCNANVDWSLMQSLHVAYIAHKFIMDFKTLGAKIHIAFFDCHDWFWAKNPQMRLIRNIVKQLLATRAEQPDAPFAFFNFASYYGGKFKAYLDLHSPEFIVLNDGEEMTAAPIDEESAKNAAQAKKVPNFKSVLGCEAHGAKAAAALHRMMVHFVANRIHVVYSSRLVHKDNNIFGFTVRASSAFFVPFEPLCPILEAQSRADAKAFAADADESAGPIPEEIGDDVKEALTGANAKNNGLIATVGAAKFLLDNKLVSGAADEAVLKAAVVAVIVQPSIAIKARFQNIDSADPKAADFVAVVSKLAGAMGDMWADLDGVRSKDYDAFDGHLIAAISLLCAETAVKDLVSDEDTIEQINEAWAVVTGAESANITDAPITGAHFIAHKPAPKEGPFIFYNHELVNSLCGAYGVQPLPAGSKAANVTEDLIGKALAKFGKWLPNKDFVEYNAVISEKEEAEKKRIDEERAAVSRRFREALKRKEARYFHAIDEIARSMNVLESKVTTGKKSTDASAAATAAATSGHSGQRNTNTVSRAQEIQESNAVNLIIKSVSETMDRTASKLKQFERASIKGFDPLTATPEQTRDFMRVLKDTVDYANSIAIIRESEEEVKDGKGNNPYTEIFRRAYAAGSDGRTAYDFICSRNKDSFHARQALERIAKDFCKKAEDLAALEKKAAKKKPSEADAKKIADLREIILVNEPSAARCGYFAARCFASMFQRYARFELLFTVLTFRINVWTTIKTKWFEETNVINSKADKVAFLEQQTWAPAVELWLSAHAIVDTLARETIPVPNLAQIDHVRAAIDHIGLETYRYQTFDTALKTNLGIDSLGAVPQKLRPLCTLPMDMDATTFQLRRMGERLQRDVPPEADPRVVFNADGWQRDLMDVVDARGSVIVSAPTSSGKTFISYYCMEQVFSQTISSETPTSDIGVVVYVAPTRALINQAAADVYGRYKSKSYGNLPLKIFGVLGGRDFVRTPFDCQALITLPDVLETILLSPHNQKWLKRVRYFIFDEVHTMEDSGNGAVWGRLLSLIRAPFVALSATIGDTNNLLAWLNRAQERQKAQDGGSSSEPRRYDVQLIPKAGTTIARWSDIEKHVFIPTTTRPLESLHRETAPKLVDRNDIVGFHPLSVTNFEMLSRKDAFPADCGIVPRETVDLIQQMFTSFSPVYEGEFGDVPAVAAIVDRLRKLAPDAYMKGLLHISQTKARRWEADVKMELLTWVRMGTTEGLEKLDLDLGAIADDEDQLEALAEAMKGVCESVLGAFSAAALDREQQLIDKARNGEMAYPDTTAFIHSGIVRCLYTLLSRNLAPSIIFVLDQEECERLVETVITALEEAESNYRSTPAFRAFERRMAADREANDKLRASKASVTHQKEGDDENRNEGDRSANAGDLGDVRPDSDFIIPDVLAEFTFAPMVALDDDLSNALDDNPNEKKTLLFRALQRGIGMHHNGISGKLRGSVERAFRKLQLPFVFSTEGLALGIHSPCRTVVLAGDNIALNVSEFRQMAGRAGRRGLDFLGHVVFFGISVKKIKRLMTGEMANLRGHSQIDPTTAMRLLQLYNNRFDNKPGAPSAAEWHKHVANIAELAYVDPLFVRGRAQSKDYCKDHIAHLRHMMTYFAREGLVNASAQAASSIGNMIVTMLNIRNNARLETAGFALASMLTNQTLEKMAVATCDDPASVEYTRSRMHGAALAAAYVLTLHNKFHVPLEVHRSILRDPLAIYLRRHASARTHTVYLPSPNAAIQAQLDLQSGRILKVLSHYVADRANFIELDPTLPLGLVNARGDIVTVVPNDSDESLATLHAKLAATANMNVKARHPLIALSGKTDNFESVEDITQSLANGLFLDLSDVPAIDLGDLGRHDGAHTLINAAFYDYIRNGSQKRGEDNVRLHLMLYNNLTQSASWGTLNQMFIALDSLNIAMGEICKEDITNPTHTAVNLLTERCQQLRDELDNRPQWKRDARAGIAATLNA